MTLMTCRDIGIAAQNALQRANLGADGSIESWELKDLEESIRLWDQFVSLRLAASIGAGADAAEEAMDGLLWKSVALTHTCSFNAALHSATAAIDIIWPWVVTGDLDRTPALGRAFAQHTRIVVEDGTPEVRRHADEARRRCLVELARRQGEVPCRKLAEACFTAVFANQAWHDPYDLVGVLEALATSTAAASVDIGAPNLGRIAVDGLWQASERLVCIWEDSAWDVWRCIEELAQKLSHAHGNPNFELAAIEARSNQAIFMARHGRISEATFVGHTAIQKLTALASECGESETFRQIHEDLLRRFAQCGITPTAPNGHPAPSKPEEETDERPAVCDFRAAYATLCCCGSKDVLRREIASRPELLDPALDLEVRAWSTRQRDDSVAERILQLHSLLVRCRKIGLDQALAEYTALPATSENARGDRCIALVTGLIRADGLAAKREFIERNPDILEPDMTPFLRGDDRAEPVLKWVRGLLTRCREAGVATAFEELARTSR